MAIEIVQTTTTTATKTVQIVLEIFSRFGLPETIVSDNGTQFTSKHFLRMCDLNGITHLRCAPYHAQSNGQAERFVDTLKRALKKIKGEKSLEETLQTFLFYYRTTPNPNSPGGKSPSEIMLGRKARTVFDLMLPSKPHAAERPSHQKDKQNHQFNRRHGAKHRQFNRGDFVYAKVYYKNKITWFPGQVKDRVGRVMYKIKLDNERAIVSHTNQLKHRESSSNVQSPSSPPTPLHMLLDEFNINEHETIQGNDSTSTTTYHDETNVNPSTTEHYDNANSNPSPQESSYVRRSSRATRVPHRLEPYLLY